MSGNRRAYPTDPTNTLSYNSVQHQQQMGQPQIVPNTGQFGQLPPNQQQNTQLPQQQQQQQGYNQFSPNQQQQQQMSNQQGGGLQPPVIGTTGGIDQSATSAVTKRVYPVDANNETFLTSQFNQMNLNQQQYQQPPQTQQQPYPQQQQYYQTTPVQQLSPPITTTTTTTTTLPPQQQQVSPQPIQSNLANPLVNNTQNLYSPVQQHQTQTMHQTQTPPVTQPTTFSPQGQQTQTQTQPQPQPQTQPQPQPQGQGQGYQQFIPTIQNQQNGAQGQIQQQPQLQGQGYQQFTPQYNNYSNYQPPIQTNQPIQSNQPMVTTPSSFIPEAPLPTAENLCPKQYMRMSMNVVPNLPSTLSKVHIPLGVVINPLADAPNEPIPLINSNIVRCRSCRAYINPFVIFTDGGARWKCNICQFLNDTPADYVSPINLTTGKRFDIDQRPELQRGCVEFVATSEYAVRAPQPPCYFFIIDVCYESIVSGMLNCAIQAIRQSLDNLPGESRTRFGIMTFDDQLHLFNLKASPSLRPQMYVVTEMDNVFVPPFDDFLVNLKDNRELIDNTLNIIQNMERKTQKVESCLGSAFKAAYQITQRVGGKIMIFQSYIPRGPIGKLPMREYQSSIGTKKEVKFLQPNGDVETYKEFALACSQHHISVDTFMFATDYTDVASLGQLSQITGGEVHYYPQFVANRDGRAFMNDLSHSLTRTTAWEAVMRVRNSRGLNTTAYHGNYFLKSSDLLALPTVDSDKTFTLQLGITDNIPGKYAALQSALLYTHSCGERRVRVFTVSLPVVQNYHDLFKHADISVVVNLISKMAIDKALSSSLPDAREAIANKCAEILIAYKTTLSSNASSSVTLSTQAPKLLLPETLKHLPLYVVSMVKNIIFSSKATSPDVRSFHMQRMKTLDTNLCLNFFYPYFYSLLQNPQQLQQQDETQPFQLPISHKLSADELSRSGCYMIVNGFTIYIFVGEAIDPQVHQDIFGCDYQSLDQLTFQDFPVLENPHSVYVRKVLHQVRSSFPRYQGIYLIKGNTQRRSEIQSLLVEDRTPEGSSYYEFILQLQSRVLQ
ncbi:putative transport protein [Tieghemostelium lacteum]|uniref:Putative transport protein n=1 Tax=Tieghemostelium lacteum TaxID=361077 RepID=A0A151Z6P4_TIELA|nr:putative transport protein [Tieghemostelium lacteum]|eukprot:KYQ89636.1 putative transport protein [Tieghemostelium lacteum]